MGAPLEFCSKKGVVAVLASGVVISLTALTGGIAPALAQPGDDSGATTTVVAPEPEVAAPEEAAPQAPQTQAPAPQTQAPAPQTQAPAPAQVETEVETQATVQAPTTTVAPPVTTVVPAEPSEEDVTTASQAPITTAPSTTAAPETASTSVTSATTSAPTTTATEAAETSATTTAPSDALTPTSETSATTSTSAPSTTETSGSETTESASGDESETPTVSITQAANIETVLPKTLEAPEADVELASKATVVDETIPAPAPEQDLASFSQSIETSLKIPGLDVGTSASTNFAVNPPVELVSPVRQWRPEWVQYDEYYRPIIINPYRDPVRIVYMYEMAPRIMVIPPLGRMMFEAAQYAAYSFTAALLSPVIAAANVAQAVTNIAVGSFFGGGYYPGVGMPPPPPPPPVLRYDNVPVLVNYSNARYEPFRVRQIVDVGDDAQFGERKVLLDGVTPAWGVWAEGQGGERTFEVHRTQQFPGLGAPAEGPLPGDYRLRLASDEAPTAGLTGRDIFLMVSAGVIGTLGFGAIGLAFFLGRRRNQEI
ncbi:hypothetical protein H7J93_23500 [Mycobacterium barrassiae]|uniref:hypothetical protein n=1 Tax=Mycobacterium barrassiae TaxID=319709 RepID=UPI002265B070|nr:hypothetical protein [Mycobacterium barrassiae]MCV7302595.1 hypothetical protein [Mycobacterium barrassiae]